MSDTDRDDKDQLWSEATVWFARMRSPDAEDYRAEFEAWLARGALHRRYYNRAKEHWLHGTVAYAAERAQIHGASAETPQPKSAPGGRRPALAAVAAVSIAIVGTAFLFAGHHADLRGSHGSESTTTAQPQLGQLRVATRRGEQRSLRLADGSLVTLGERTALVVNLSKLMRRLELDHGQAEFDVAHETRPFVVFAGGGSVTARGTLFNVALTSDRRVAVRLIRGSVDVRFPTGGASVRPARRLQPGEAVSFPAASPKVAGSAAEASAPQSAQAARDYREVTLADLVDEANRQTTVPIRFADPVIGAKRVSGRFRIDDTNVLADRLAALFDLVADRSHAGEILLRPR